MCHIDDFLLFVYSVTSTIFYFLFTVILLSVYNVTIFCLQCHVVYLLFTVSLLSVYSVTTFCLQCHIDDVYFLFTVSLLSVYSVTSFCLQCHFFLFSVSYWRSLRHGHQGDLWDGTRRSDWRGDRGHPHGLHTPEHHVPVQRVQADLSQLSPELLRRDSGECHESEEGKEFSVMNLKKVKNSVSWIWRR